MIYSLIKTYGPKIGLTRSMISGIRKKFNLSKNYRNQNEVVDSFSSLTSTLLSDSSIISLVSNRTQQKNNNNNNLDTIIEQNEITKTMNKSMFFKPSNIFDQSTLKHHICSKRIPVTLPEETLQKLAIMPEKWMKKLIKYNVSHPTNAKFIKNSRSYVSKSNEDIRQIETFEQSDNNLHESNSITSSQKTTSFGDLTSCAIKNLDLNLFKEEIKKNIVLNNS
jgi:hypothetical protein